MAFSAHYVFQQRTTSSFIPSINPRWGLRLSRTNKQELTIVRSRCDHAGILIVFQIIATQVWVFFD